MKNRNLGIGIGIVVLAIAGGMFFWNTRQFRNEIGTGGDKQLAEQTLVNFFDFLVKKDAQSAVDIFYPTNAKGDYAWSLVTMFPDPTKQNPTKADELAYYCVAVGTCLKVDVLSGTEVARDFYSFDVQFRDKDGAIFLYGPFGGETAEQNPPETKFKFSVKKIDGVYKVITPPLYRP